MGEKSEFFRQIFDLAPGILLVLDSQGRVAQINRQGAEILGLEKEDILGKDWFAHFLPERERKAVRQVFERLMAGELEPVEYYENPILMANGEEKFFFWHNSLLKDEKGRPKAILSYGVDISEKRRQEDQLKLLTNKLDLLLQSLTDGILFETPDRKVEFINPAFMKLFGINRATSIIGLDCREAAQRASHLFVEPDKFIHRIEEIIASRTEIKGEQLVLRDGRIFERDYFPLLKDQKPFGHLWIYRDITSRKQFEDKILENLLTVSAIYVGSQRLGECLDLEEVARQAAQVCVNVFKLKLAWIGKAEPDGNVSLLYQYPENVSYPQEIKVRWDNSPEGQGPTGRAICTGFPQITIDIQEDEKFSPWRAKAIKAGFRSSAAFPLITRGKAFGALNLYSDQPGFFTGERVELFQAFAYQVAAALENARLFQEMQSKLKILQALRNIDLAIAGSLDIRVTLSVLLDEVTQILEVDAASVLMFNPHSQTLEYAAGRGFKSKDIKQTLLSVRDSFLGQAIYERKTIIIPNAQERIESFIRAQMLKKENFQVYVATPMIAKLKVLGVLEVFHRSPLKIEHDWVESLESLASQAAIAVENAKLFSDLERSYNEIQQAYDATIEGWAKALELRDRETEGHTQRVAEITLQLAKKLGVPDDQLIHIRRGALLHDIGKIGVPDSILLKPGPLDESEWSVMRSHPEFANKWLGEISFLRPALDIPLYHHEKWDGTGYPKGLKGEQIPLAARIFAIVDVYDALTTERPYRPAWPKEKALAYIQEQSGKHFDPNIVAAFLEIIS